MEVGLALSSALREAQGLPVATWDSWLTWVVAGRDPHTPPSPRLTLIALPPPSPAGESLEGRQSRSQVLGAPVCGTEAAGSHGTLDPPGSVGRLQLPQTPGLTLSSLPSPNLPRYSEVSFLELDKFLEDVR